MTWTNDEMCKIAVDLEIRDGLFINLGIGMPTNIPNFIPSNINVCFQSENGMLGIGAFPKKGEEDPDLINAGKQTITAIPESSYFDSSSSFAMIRGSHVDLTILGALQVASNGDLANWAAPGKMIKGMGGAMDLVANIEHVVVMMTHNAKDGSAKLVEKCSLPLTGVGVVDRVITDIAVFDIKDGKTTLVKVADGITIDEVKERTDAKFDVAQTLLN
ncbi:MAG: 3-oxoacid CoA-transferase subunit B [Rickettsiaceae bacterium]|nr:3-oxoacid CoA-transferase subunit B [Rickettsiaceae bacterium]